MVKVIQYWQSSFAPGSDLAHKLLHLSTHEYTQYYYTYLLIRGYITTAGKKKLENVMQPSAQIIVTKEDDVKVKSPPISYRTRSGRSKIPRKRLNVTDDLATANDENLDVRNSEKEYSSDSESSLEEELEQEAIVDPSVSNTNMHVTTHLVHTEHLYTSL